MQESEHSAPSNERKPQTSKFVRKLYDMLSVYQNLLQKEQYREHIGWNPQGDGFLIFKPFQFEQAVLRHYFKHGNLQSFLRQLNMYNFKRKRSEGEGLHYQHNRFRREDDALLPLIRRKKEEKPRRKKQLPQKNQKFPEWALATSKPDKQLWKDVYSLINFNRRLMEENRELWKLFTMRAARLHEELDPVALGTEAKRTMAELAQTTSRIGQMVEVVHDLRESQAVVLERTFEDVLNDYQAIRSVAESNLQSHESEL